MTYSWLVQHTRHAPQYTAPNSSRRLPRTWFRMQRAVYGSPLLSVARSRHSQRCPVAWR